MAIHIGHRRAGWPGLLVAGICFILPAMLIVLGCAWAYVRFGKLPRVEAVLYGVKPVIIAIVLQALWGLTKTAVKSVFLGVAAAAAAILAAIGVNELVVLFGCGVAVAMVRRIKFSIPLLPAIVPMAAAASAGATAFSTTAMFLFFLKVGSVLFGSGYVLLAFLRTDLVERWGWLTETQLLDAVAIGQVTPGPVFTTATFIGYLLGGTWGGLVATIGIFLPAFVFVALSGPLVPRIRRSPAAGAFLDGINAASLALMAVVTAHLARAALVDWLTVLLALAAAIFLLRYRVNSAWLVGAGAVAGFVKALAT
jgi:chromate transporter